MSDVNELLGIDTDSDIDVSGSSLSADFGGDDDDLDIFSDVSSLDGESSSPDSSGSSDDILGGNTMPGGDNTSLGGQDYVNNETKRETYNNAFAGGTGVGEASVAIPRASTIEQFVSFFTNNYEVYSKMNVLQYVFIGIGMISVFLIMWAIGSKFIYILSYYYVDVTNIFTGMGRYFIMFVLLILLYIVYDILDGKSKMLNDIQLPIKFVTLLSLFAFGGGFMELSTTIYIVLLLISILAILRIFGLDEYDQKNINDIAEEGVISNTAVVENIESIEATEKEESMLNIDMTGIVDDIVGQEEEKSDVMKGLIEELCHVIIDFNKEKKYAGVLLGENTKGMFITAIDYEETAFPSEL